MGEVSKSKISDYSWNKDLTVQWNKSDIIHTDQNGSGAHPASYPMGTRGSFSGGKAAGSWS
jgi:hypothetical protein